MREVTFYKYQGAGNDFLVADNRDSRLVLTPEAIASICDRRYGVGADGVMLLAESDSAAFRMEYYNADGSGGMMCGNGGRCIAAFAVDMGIAGPVPGFCFEAADGMHEALVLDDGGKSKIVRLKMKDVSGLEWYDALDGVGVPSDGYFLDTGTRHFVRFVENVPEYDVVREGREIRYAGEFLPVGTNVNYVGRGDGCLVVRTYEKGVEDETFACGTGIVASCVAAYAYGLGCIGGRKMERRHEAYGTEDAEGRVTYAVQAVRDLLSVDFVPSVDGTSLSASQVWLTGPAVRVAEIRIPL